MIPSSSSILLFGTLALAALVIGVAFAALWRRRGGGALLVASVLWLAYGAWELWVQWFTPEANIRFDLLAIYPLLLFVTLAALIQLWRAS